jgi:hypothetical protein
MKEFYAFVRLYLLSCLGFDWDGLSLSWNEKTAVFLRTQRRKTNYRKELGLEGELQSEFHDAWRTQIEYSRARQDAVNKVIGCS